MSGEQAANPEAPVLIHLTDDLGKFAAIIRQRLLLAVPYACIRVHPQSRRGTTLPMRL